jgi:recombinase
MQQNISRYRALELFAESVAELDLGEVENLAKLLGKIQRRARQALSHKQAPRNERLGEARQKARESTMRRAREFKEQVMPHIEQARREGCTTTRQIADWLNKKNISTPRGGSWQSSTVYRVMKGDE